LVVGPMVAAAFGVPSLFWLAACLAVAGGLLLTRLPAHVERPASSDRWNLRPAFRADLLRLDLYVFLLHAILTASFVALPFLLANKLELAITDHWQIYVGALLVSLLGTIPLIISDERQGKAATIGIAVALVFTGELLLAFVGVAVWPVFLALVVFFAGFNFLEAGLPARLSMLADGETRGASLGVFSSAQFFGAFVGGLIGGRYLAAGRPADVFFVCALLAAIWLAMSGVFRRQSALRVAGNNNSIIERGPVMARGINKVIIVGNLGGDPETRYMPSGSAVTNLTVATNESWKDKQTGEQKERTEWHKVAMFNRLAEIAAEYLRKGSQVYIEGKLRTRKWQDKEGKDRWTTEIIADEMQMLSGRSGGGGGGSAPMNQDSGPASAPAQAGPDDFDDDIPF